MDGDALHLPPHGGTARILEFVPDAAAPSLTRLRIRQADRPGELAEVVLTISDLYELARLARRQAERARPHELAAIEAVFAGPAEPARRWLP
jgi:regulator of protease activity HflC (stomatin/prohibitin superfamily)